MGLPDWVIMGLVCLVAVLVLWLTDD